MGFNSWVEDMLKIGLRNRISITETLSYTFGISYFYVHRLSQNYHYNYWYIKMFMFGICCKIRMKMVCKSYFCSISHNYYKIIHMQPKLNFLQPPSYQWDSSTMRILWQDEYLGWNMVIISWVIALFLHFVTKAGPSPLMGF